MQEMVTAALGERFHIERELARGGSGRVYLATTAEGTEVALKVLHPELQVSVAADRFLREISVLSKLDHPRITRLLDYGEKDWLVYFVMDYAEGATLKAHLHRVTCVPIDDVYTLADHLLDALGYAHAQGIVHRDVKPDNIVLTPQGAMLLDFGIARAIEVAGTEQLTRSGFTVGTSTYMSPEQAMAAKSLDHRTDLYSLGCVLYECVAGRAPFVHPNEAVVLGLQIKEPPPKLTSLRPETPAPLVQALERSLAKKPEDRWQNAADFAAALQEARVARR